MMSDYFKLCQISFSFPDAQELEPVAQMYVWSPVDLVKDVETMVTEMVMKESRIDEKKPTNCIIDTLW